MRRVYKYPLDVIDQQTIMLPNGAEVLTVQAQNETVCLWALVDDSPPTPRTFRIAGTGHSLPDLTADWKYIGSVQLSRGALVFHVWEIQS